MDSFWFAFGLTIIAGLATGIGSLIALIAKRTNAKFLSVSLGFSAGVMLYISFMEIIPMAKEELALYLGDRAGMLSLLLAFFGGMGVIAAIDFLIPKSSNPHEFQNVEDMNNPVNRKSLKRMGVLVAVALVIHNFPEGIAVFATAMNGELSLAIPIAIAVAIHNIPEGIAVSVPIYHATGSKRKAFWISFLSGLAEPLGALVAFFFLMPFWSPLVSGVLMAAVAGIMVFISLDELLPAAEKYGKHHLSISGLIAGMMVMALSLYLLM